MRVQQTFKNGYPTVYLVGTPIGNLEDMSIRALKILEEVDLICCEDTRTTLVLLKKFDIQKPLISLHMHNEVNRLVEITLALSQGKNIAIVSDAGAPVISDPGAAFIAKLKQIEDLNFNVTAVNVGPAYIHAIVAAGFINKQNYFYGFIENKANQAKREELIKVLNKYNNDSIISFYESVHRIRDTIEMLNEIMNNKQQIVVAREITKLNEEFIYGTIAEVNTFIQSDSFIEKGEFVIVIDQFENKPVEATDKDLAKEVNNYVEKGFKLKEASEIVANLYGKKKNDIYKIYLDFYK